MEQRWASATVPFSGPVFHPLSALHGETGGGALVEQLRPADWRDGLARLATVPPPLSLTSRWDRNIAEPIKLAAATVLIATHGASRPFPGTHAAGSIPRDARGRDLQARYSLCKARQPATCRVQHAPAHRSQGPCRRSLPARRGQPRSRQPARPRRSKVIWNCLSNCWRANPGSRVKNRPQQADVLITAIVLSDAHGAS